MQTKKFKELARFESSDSVSRYASRNWTRTVLFIHRLEQMSLPNTVLLFDDQLTYDKILYVVFAVPLYYVVDIYVVSIKLLSFGK